MLPVNKGLKDVIFKGYPSMTDEQKSSAELQYFLEAKYDPFAIMLVNRLAATCDVKLVFHSDRMTDIEPEVLRAKLVNEGVVASHFHEQCFCRLVPSSGLIGGVSKWVDVHGDCDMAFVAIDSVPAVELEELGRAVRVDPNEGFTLDDYRMACGALEGRDPFASVFVLPSELMVKVKNYISNGRERNAWLYSVSHNKGKNAPRVAFLSREASDISFRKSGVFGRSSENAHMYYLERSAPFQIELERSYGQGAKHPRVICSADDLYRLMGFGLLDPRAPIALPCAFFGDKSSPEYIYPPSGVIFPEDYLAGVCDGSGLSPSSE